MNVTYWISTSLVCAMLTVSAFTYLFHQATIDGVQALGFPHFFRIQLAALKILAIAALLAPAAPAQVKEWAYAGVGLFFITAIVAHIAHQDSFGITLINLILIGLLITSHVSRQA